MAVLRRLEDQLNCSICLDTYTNPKQLQCNHVYCQQCLVQLVVRDQQGQLSLTCPTCRQVTPVPASGVTGLPAAFQINQLLEIVKENKETATASAEEAESVFTSSTSSGHTITIGCPKHGGKEVELYCETCGKTICWECIMTGSKHHSHKYDKLDKAFENYKEEIIASLEPLEKHLTTVEKALEDLETRREEISNQRATIEADICNTIRCLHETLDVRKTELISQLHRLTQAKLKDHAAQRDQIETSQAQLSSCLLFMRENLKTGNQREALLMRRTTVRQVRELTTTFQPDALKPRTKADMLFSKLADLSLECQTYGEITILAPPDPSKCHITSEGVLTADVREKFTILLHIESSTGEPCTSNSTISVSSELKSEIASCSTRGSVERKGQNQYQISHQPNIKGRHQLCIKVEGQHIRGSPFSVAVRSPVEKLGAHILTITGLKNPEGVAITHTGEVAVTELSEHCVSIFSTSGKRLRTFGTNHTSGWAQFDHPAGVAVDNTGNILITNCSNHRIQKFTVQGKFLAAVGGQVSGPLQFAHPRGITFNASNGKIYVVDFGNHRILILNPNLSLFDTFGQRGSGMGQFENPWHIACDSTGNVYVADCNNHRIQVFTACGEFVRLFGRRGEGRGELNGPTGIAVDSSDRVYVSEWKNSRVSVFTSSGRFLKSFGSKGKGPGQFSCTRNIAVDSSGVVYVCDSKNGNVQLF